MLTWGGFFFIIESNNKGKPNMSCLQNELLLEQCFDEAWEEFRVHNELTVEMMEDLCSFSQGTVDAIEGKARQMFEDMIQ